MLKHHGYTSLAMAGNWSRDSVPTSSGCASRRWASALATSSSSLAPRTRNPSWHSINFAIICLLPTAAVDDEAIVAHAASANASATIPRPFRKLAFMGQAARIVDTEVAG